MRKDDLFNECYDREVSPEEFKQVFCDRCRNPTCVNAGWAQDKFGSRVDTQMDRLFNTTVASPDDPRFAHIHESDFPNLLNQAIRLNIADQRGDWSLPESPEVNVVLSPIEGEPAGDESEKLVEQAVRNLTGTQGEQVEASDQDTPKNPSQKPDKKTQKTSVTEPKSPEPQHFQDVKSSEAPAKAPQNPRLTNTVVADEGVMIGGDPLPTTQPEEVVDPWEPKKETILKPGATVVLGSGSGSKSPPKKGNKK